VALLLALDNFWNIGKSGVLNMLAQLSPTTGESPSRSPGAGPRSEREERMALLAERPKKSVLWGRDDMGWRDNSCMGVPIPNEQMRSKVMSAFQKQNVERPTCMTSLPSTSAVKLGK